MIFFILSPIKISSLCRHEQDLKQPITFNKQTIQVGDTFCIHRIPPRTSIVFKHLPYSQIEARYLVNGTVIPLNGTNQTRGFDTGDYEGEIEVTALESGNLSFFSVTFPNDCDTRIVSSRQLDVLYSEKDSGKVCYFNGAKRVVDYEIRVDAGETGKVESPGLGINLRGSSKNHLHQVNSSLITWSGDMNKMIVSVWAGHHPHDPHPHRHHHHDDGLSVTLNGRSPCLIELSPTQNEFHGRDRSFFRYFFSWNHFRQLGNQHHQHHQHHGEHDHDNEHSNWKMKLVNFVHKHQGFESENVEKDHTNDSTNHQPRPKVRQIISENQESQSNDDQK